MQSTVHLHHGAGLTREQSKACYADGQRKWWICAADHEDPEFISTGQAAVYPLDWTGKLHHGDYILGCGTGASKLRRKFRVDAFGFARWL